VGDREAWEQIVYLYSPLVHRWCYRRHLKADDIPGIGQDVFLALFKNLGQFRKDQEGYGFRKWLWTITTNKINDHLRKLQDEPPGVGGSTARELLENYPDGPTKSESESDGRPTSHEERLMLLRRALDLVKSDFEPRTYEAFREVVLNNQAPGDVARLLGMKSVGAVYTARSRVMRRLHELLSQLGEDLSNL
jgi:RNA polymerase sigma-70 factor (ECF subfamily)